MSTLIFTRAPPSSSPPAPIEARIDAETAPSNRSIAVLPFIDLSPGGDQAYFSEGLAEEILNALVRVDGLRVPSRTSSFAYRDQTGLAVRKIAGQLGVRHVLEGSVRNAGARIRVSVQLIDAFKDQQLWSETYDRELTVENLLEIQQFVADAIVAELQTEFGEALSAQDIRTTSAAAGTDDMDAYDAYLKANERFADRRNIGEALDYLREAVRIDPGFARGWELLAATAFVENGQPTGEAQHAVSMALQLQPNLSLAHALQGVMGNINPPYDWDLALDRLKRAVALDPKNTTALQWLALENRKLGYLDRALQLFDRCLEVDPAYHRCRLHRAWAAHMNGRTDLAMNDYRKLVADGAPPDDDVLLLAFLAAGETAWADRVVRSLSQDPPFPAALYEALKSGAPNNDPRLKSRFRDWLAEIQGNPRDHYSTALAFGAYDVLEIRQGSYFGLWLPEFPEYRTSDDFKRFVRVMRMDAYWRRHGFPPQCRALGERDFTCGP